MKIDKEQFEALCAAYALGALDAEGQKSVHDSLPLGGEEYQRIFQESVNISYLINTSITIIAPSPAAKSRLVKRIHNEKRSALPLTLKIEKLAVALGFGNPRFGLLVSFLLLIVVGEIVTYTFFLHRDLMMAEQQVSSIESQFAEQQRYLTSLTTDQKQKEEILNVLRSPKIEVVIMNGLDVNPAGYGKIIWDPVRKIAILQVSNLPAAPSDRDYQLWFLDKANKPVNAGIFNVSAQDENYFRVSEIPLPENEKDISAFAVTIEPKGGVPQPTGAMYLLGSLTTKN